MNGYNIAVALFLTLLVNILAIDVAVIVAVRWFLA